MMTCSVLQYPVRLELTYYELGVDNVCALRAAVMNYVSAKQIEKKNNVSLHLHDYEWNDGYSFTILIEADDYDSFRERKSDSYVKHYNRLRELDKLMIKLKQICDSTLQVQ